MGAGEDEDGGGAVGSAASGEGGGVGACAAGDGGGSEEAETCVREKEGGKGMKPFFWTWFGGMGECMECWNDTNRCLAYFH